MQQTPVHHQCNPDLLALMPITARRVVEIGCSSGALAREYKRLNPECHYIGCDIDASYVEMAKQHCDQVLLADIDAAGDDFYESVAGSDLWVFGDTLEHMKDPWAVLRQVSGVMSLGGMVVACVPNAQHWSVQARLATGAFWYESAGLLDRTHLRWFTKKTLPHLFEQAGFQVQKILPRVFEEPGFDVLAPVIEEMAELAGGDVQAAVADARPLQYLVMALLR